MFSGKFNLQHSESRQTTWDSRRWHSECRNLTFRMLLGQTFQDTSTNFPTHQQNFPGHQQNFPGQHHNFPGHQHKFPGRENKFSRHQQNFRGPEQKPARTQEELTRILSQLSTAVGRNTGQTELGEIPEHGVQYRINLAGGSTVVTFQDIITLQDSSISHQEASRTVQDASRTHLDNTKGHGNANQNIAV